MDVLTRHTKDDTSWYIVFADAIVLVDEIKVELWRSALESKCFKLSWFRMEYMKCNFSEIRNRNKDGAKLVVMDFLRVIIFDI